jgi:hypothetical protein
MKRLKTEMAAATALKSMASNVTASWALPSDFSPFRMRNEYSTEETALFKVNEEHAAVVGQSSTGQQLRADTHMEFIFQDALRNRISYQRNATGSSWVYQWCFSRNTSGVDQTGFTVRVGGTETVRVSHATAGSTFKPHGDTLFGLEDNGMQGVWIDALATLPSLLSVFLGTLPTTTQGSIVLWAWNNGIWKEQQRLAITNPTVLYNFTISVSSYYTIQVINPSNDQVVGATAQGTCDCWGHFPSPYLLSNANSVESIRMLGHSILVKNVTAVQQKQGAIVACQPGKSRSWTSFASFDGTSDTFSVVRDYAGAANTRLLETGLYGFIKPTDEEDVKLKEPFTICNVNGVSGSTVWTFAGSQILNTPYVVVAAQCNTLTPQQVLIRTDQNGEYETGNQWFNVDKPRAEPQEWRDGMEALASMQQFYENPTHWKRILSTIGSVASVGGRILSLFGPKGAAVGVPVSMAGDMMRSGFQ